MTTASCDHRAAADAGEQGIIHKDINPSNIVWNPHERLLEIIDFGIATRLFNEAPILKDSGILEGTCLMSRRSRLAA